MAARPAQALGLAALCTLLSLQPLGAQNSVSTVAEIRRDTGATHVPDQLGQTVTVRGVITARPLTVESGALISHLQDATGGITLVAKSGKILPADLVIGDVVQATGRLNQYRGAEELIVSKLDRYARGSATQPVSVTAADANGERLEGQLVHLSGELLVTRSEDGLTAVLLRDDTGTIPLTLSRRFSDPAFQARLRDGGVVEITGIINQSDAAPPFDSGYRVAPRDPADIGFAPRPPYAAIVTGALVMLLLWFGGYLWLRRRSAELRAEALSASAADLRATATQLRASEARLAAVLSNLPAVVYGLDSDGIFTMSEGSGLKALGLEPGEAVGASAFEMYGSDPELAAQLRRALTGEPTAWTTSLGERRLDNITIPFRDPEGTLTEVIGLAFDITERESQTAAVREAEQRAQLMAERMSAVAAAAAGVVTAATPAQLQEVLWNACEGTLVFDSCRIAIYDPRQHLLRLPAHARQSGAATAISVEGHPSEAVIRGRRSEILHFSGSPAGTSAVLHPADAPPGTAILAPITDDDQVLGVLWVACEGQAEYNPEDVEVLEAVAALAGPAIHLMRMMGELRRSEERFAKAFAGNPSPLAISSLATGRFLAVNEAYMQATGYSGGRLIGQTSAEAGMWADPAERTQVLETLQAVGAVRKMEVVLVAADGGLRSVLVSADVMEMNGEQCILSTLIDITERKALEERLSHDAFHDRLTDLPNRTLFRDRVAQGLARGRRNGRPPRRTLSGPRQLQARQRPFRPRRRRRAAGHGGGAPPPLRPRGRYLRTPGG